MTEDDLPAPPQNSGHSTLAPPPILYDQSGSNWPIKNLGESFFDRALANGGVDAAAAAGDAAANGAAEQLDAWAVDEDLGADDEEVAEDEGWDLDADVIAAEEEDKDDFQDAPNGQDGADLSEGVQQGVSEDDMWMRNSPLAADHAAAGGFESAMQVSHCIS